MGAIAVVPPSTVSADEAARARSARLETPAARDLLPSIDKLLKAGLIDRSHIAAVAVTVGPGSFTGSRIGVTAAKTIAYALGIPVVGVNTQDAMADAGPRDGASRLWIALDAQRGDLFVAEYRLPWEHSPEHSDPTRLQSKSTWLGQLAQDDLVMGAAALQQELPSGIRFAELPPSENVAEATGRLGWHFLEWGQTTSPFDLVPRYYRESAAEEKRRLA